MATENIKLKDLEAKSDEDLSKNVISMNKKDKFLLCWKYFQTAVVYFTYFFSGLSNSILCQTLVFISDYTETSTTEVSAIYLWIGIGIGIGSLISGFILEHVKSFIVLAVASLIAGGFHILIPFYDKIIIVYVLYGCQALFLGTIYVGTTLLVLKLWKDKSGPFIAAYLLMFSLPGIFSPWVISTFIEKDEESENISKYINESAYSETMDEKKHLKEVAHVVHFKSNILVACCMFFATILCIIANVMKNLQSSTGQNTSLCFISKTTRVVQNIDKKPQYFLIQKVCILLFTLLMILLATLQAGFTSLLVIFINIQLHWSKSSAIMMSSVLFLSRAIASVLAIPLNKLFSPIVVLIISIICMTLMLLLLAFFINYHISIIWLCTILIGSITAIQMPCTLSWANTVVPVTGKVAAAFNLPYSLCWLGGSIPIGYIMDKFGPMFYAYILLLYNFMIIILFILTFICSKKAMKKSENEPCVTNIQANLLSS